LEEHGLKVFVNDVLRRILGRIYIEGICEQGSEKNTYKNID
jgi:hypothetical protein